MLNIMMFIFEYKSKSKVMKMISVSERGIFKIFLGGMPPDPYASHASVQSTLNVALFS